MWNSKGYLQIIVSDTPEVDEEILLVDTGVALENLSEMWRAGRQDDPVCPDL
jgi:hypothetical protein